MQLVAQRRPFDCGVAALATLIHVEYSDVFYVAARVAGDRIRRGLTIAEMIRIAKRFRHPLARLHPAKVDLDNDSGILSVSWTDRPRWADGHWVVLRRGTIIDPDKAAVWDADDYFGFYKAKAGTLLVER